MVAHIVINIFPTEATEAFGGMYQYTPMMTLMKSILNVGTIIVFLMAHKWLSREENLVKQGEFYLLTLFTLFGMYLMISSGTLGLEQLRELKKAFSGGGKLNSQLSSTKPETYSGNSEFRI